MQLKVDPSGFIEFLETLTAIYLIIALRNKNREYHSCREVCPVNLAMVLNISWLPSWNWELANCLCISLTGLSVSASRICHCSNFPRLSVDSNVTLTATSPFLQDHGVMHLTEETTDRFPRIMPVVYINWCPIIKPIRTFIILYRKCRGFELSRASQAEFRVIVWLLCKIQIKVDLSHQLLFYTGKCDSCNTAFSIHHEGFHSENHIPFPFQRFMIKSY